MGSRVTTTAAFDAEVFGRETGWEFAARGTDTVTAVEVLTPSVTTAQLTAAIDAHDPTRRQRERAAERAAAIATLSTSSVGQAVLQLLGVSSDVTTRRS